MGAKNIKKNINMELEAADAEFEKLYDCPEGCGRSFKRNALEKHIKFCKSVFLNKNKEEGTAQKSSSIAPNKQAEKKEDNRSASTQKWKKDSEALRKLIKKGKGEKVDEPEILVEAPDKVCDICSKGFSENAFVRHRPICESKKKYMEGNFKK